MPRSYLNKSAQGTVPLCTYVSSLRQCKLPDFLLFLQIKQKAFSERFYNIFNQIG